MKCDHEALIALVLGDLDEDRTRKIETHAAHCQECKQRLTELRLTTSMLEALPEADRRPVSMERIRSRIETPERSASGVLPFRVLDAIAARWRWGVALAAAACFAILCFGFGVSIQVGKDFKIAVGPRHELQSEATKTASLTPTEVRAIVWSEIDSLIKPDILSLVGAVERMDARYQARLTSIESIFATRRALDRAEMRRNFHQIAATVDENWGQMAYPPGRQPVVKIDKNE